MRYTGPKNRIARREGMDLGLKTMGSKSHASLLKRMNVMPGQQAVKKGRKTSEHGKQLREKQKLRFMFGVTEGKLKSYFQKSISKTGNTANYLTQYLEKRLDNVVYRLGFAPTRAAARQLVSHKHIKVNDKMVSVASFQVRPGDVITFAKQATIKLPMVEQSLNRKDELMPAWLERQGIVGKLITEPTSEIVEKQINLRLVVEFYSR